MSVRTSHLCFQLAILVILALSSALLVDQIGLTTAFCPASAGCAAATRAAARWFGPLPLPIVSIVAYVLLLGLGLIRHSIELRRVGLLLASLGGLCGIGLLLLQLFVLKKLCPYCVLIDLLAAVVAALAWHTERKVPKTAAVEGFLRPLSLLGYVVWVLTAPPLWAHFRPARDVPVALRSLQAKGKVTLIEFVDLQCPHCRALYPTLEQLRHDYASDLTVVRLHVPRKSHVWARLGARLVHCARDPAQATLLEQGLFGADIGSQPALVAIAEGAGMPETVARQCLGDPRSERAVEEQVARFESLGEPGLPATYIGGERLTGAMPKAAYAAAIARVRRPPEQAFRQTAALLSLLGILAIAIYFVGREEVALDETRRDKSD